MKKHLKWLELFLLAIGLTSISIAVLQTAYGQTNTPNRNVDSVAGQQMNGSNSYKVKLDVDLVTVDALVRNSRGGLVTDLKSADFVVLDNGIPQKVTLFSADRIPMAVALLIENGIGIASHFPELKTAALSALNHLRQDDQVVLFSFVGCPTRLTELTRDREKVAQQIGDLGIGVVGDHYNAIYAAARYLVDKAPDRRRAIIIVSGSQVYSFPRDFAVYNFGSSAESVGEKRDEMMLRANIHRHLCRKRTGKYLDLG